jgi:hypothetical protein
MRADDEPGVPTDLHHWLSKLDQEVTALRTGQKDIIRDINDLRVSQSQLGRLPPGMIVGLASITLAIGVQTAYAVYWGGAMTAQMEMVRDRSEHTSQVIEEHIKTAGPFRNGIDRMLEDARNCDKRVSMLEQIAVRNQTKIDAIEQRNKVADQNWDILKRKGLVSEGTR